MLKLLSYTTLITSCSANLTPETDPKASADSESDSLQKWHKSVSEKVAESGSSSSSTKSSENVFIPSPISIRNKIDLSPLNLEGSSSSSDAQYKIDLLKKTATLEYLSYGEIWDYYHILQELLPGKIRMFSARELFPHIEKFESETVSSSSSESGDLKNQESDPSIQLSGSTSNEGQSPMNDQLVLSSQTLIAAKDKFNAHMQNFQCPNQNQEGTDSKLVPAAQTGKCDAPIILIGDVNAQLGNIGANGETGTELSQSSTKSFNSFINDPAHVLVAGEVHGNEKMGVQVLNEVARLLGFAGIDKEKQMEFRKKVYGINNSISESGTESGAESTSSLLHAVNFNSATGKAEPLSDPNKNQEYLHLSNLIERELSYLSTKRSIWLLPMSNPHGYYHNVREELGIDPNRDSPYMQAHTSASNSESDSNSKIYGTDCLQSFSVRMMNALLVTNFFRTFVQFHGGMKALVYPWSGPNHVLEEKDHVTDASSMKNALSLNQNLDGNSNSKSKSDSSDTSNTIYKEDLRSPEFHRSSFKVGLNLYPDDDGKDTQRGYEALPIAGHDVESVKADTEAEKLKIEKLKETSNLKGSNVELATQTQTQTQTQNKKDDTSSQSQSPNTVDLLLEHTLGINEQSSTIAARERYSIATSLDPSSYGNSDTQDFSVHSAGSHAPDWIALRAVARKMQLSSGQVGNQGWKQATEMTPTDHLAYKMSHPWYPSIAEHVTNIYWIRGGIQDWSYAGSWERGVENSRTDSLSTSARCAGTDGKWTKYAPGSSGDDGASSSSSSTAVANNLSNYKGAPSLRVLSYLVETDQNKHPSRESFLGTKTSGSSSGTSLTNLLTSGSSNEIDQDSLPIEMNIGAEREVYTNKNSQYQGHIARNIRITLSLFEMAEPSVRVDVNRGVFYGAGCSMMDKIRVFDVCPSGLASTTTANQKFSKSNKASDYTLLKEFENVPCTGLHLWEKSEDEDHMLNEAPKLCESSSTSAHCPPTFKGERLLRDIFSSSTSSTVLPLELLASDSLDTITSKILSYSQVPQKYITNPGCLVFEAQFDSAWGDSTLESVGMNKVTVAPGPKEEISSPQTIVVKSRVDNEFKSILTPPSILGTTSTTALISATEKPNPFLVKRGLHTRKVKIFFPLASSIDGFSEEYQAGWQQAGMEQAPVDMKIDSISSGLKDNHFTDKTTNVATNLKLNAITGVSATADNNVHAGKSKVNMALLDEPNRKKDHTQSQSQKLEKQVQQSQSQTTVTHDSRDQSIESDSTTTKQHSESLSLFSMVREVFVEKVSALQKLRAEYPYSFFFGSVFMIISLFFLFFQLHVNMFQSNTTSIKSNVNGHGTYNSNTIPSVESDIDNENNLNMAHHNNFYGASGDNINHMNNSMNHHLNYNPHMANYRNNSMSGSVHSLSGQNQIDHISDGTDSLPLMIDDKNRKYSRYGTVVTQ